MGTPLCLIPVLDRSVLKDTKTDTLEIWKAKAERTRLDVLELEMPMYPGLGTASHSSEGFIPKSGTSIIHSDVSRHGNNGVMKSFRMP